MESSHTNRIEAVAEGIRSALCALERYEVPINRLNVFPVPDGDTGSNMRATMAKAVAELDDLSPDLGKRVSKALLLGARGNSGVILSQIMSCLVSVLLDSISVEEGWTEGLRKAVEAAKSAILNPKAGTIISVLEEASSQPSILESVEAARIAVARTPEQLEVLARANVVDSGGAGLVVVLDEMAKSLGFEPLNYGIYVWLESAEELPEATIGDLSSIELEASGNSELRYEVMYTLEANANAVEALRVVWSGIGDSIVIVGEDDLHRCHIHTNDIGGAIEAGIAAGKVSDISVTDLREQVNEASWVTENRSGASRQGWRRTKVVAVAAGTGVSRVFRSFGVEAIVAGGQGSNPSIGEIKEAIEQQAADGVIVLPNNSNIHAVARAAIELSDRKTKMIPTVHVIEGFAALVVYDPDSDLETNWSRMSEAARSVRWGEVTSALRGGSFEGGSFSAGDWIGLSSNGITAAGSDLSAVVVELACALISPESEILTLLTGEDAVPEVTEKVIQQVRERFVWLEVEVISGEQPLYPYLLGVE
jgi:DAK2 domain fusion protein YloV